MVDRRRSKPLEGEILCLPKENTFRLPPDQASEFSLTEVKQLMDRVLGMYLSDTHYEATKCSSMCCSIVGTIKNEVKLLRYDRYKLICHVIISENQKQSMQTVSRSLWNSKSDNSVTASFTNSSLLAVATLFAVYFE